MYATGAGIGGGWSRRLNLGESDDPREFIPGDPAALLEWAQQLRTAGQFLGSNIDFLNHLRSRLDDDGWHGRASDGARMALEDSRRDHSVYETLLPRVATAYEDYTGRLRHCQQLAQKAIDLHQGFRFRDAFYTLGRAYDLHDQAVDDLRRQVSDLSAQLPTTTRRIKDAHPTPAGPLPGPPPGPPPPPGRTRPPPRHPCRHRRPAPLPT